MTARDPDRILAAYLAEGPAELSARLAGAIRDDVQHTDQRASRRPWRVPSMPRPIIVLIPVVLAVLLAGAFLLGGGGSPRPTPAPMSSPDAVVVASPSSGPTASASGLAIADGEPWLVFESDASRVSLIRPDGRGARDLAPGSGNQATPDWSPDGRRVVYAHDLDFASELWVADADGSNVRRLTDNMENCGRRFTCTQSIQPRWSPDGSSIVFILETLDQSRFLSDAIAIADASTGEVRQVYESTDSRLAWPDWSSDGRRIVVEVETYARSTDPRPAATTLAILDLDVAGGDPVAIPGLPALAGHPDWSTDGSAIVFRTNPYREGATADQTIGTTIAVVAPDGTALRPVLEQPRDGLVLRGPSWTPDGTGILYAAMDGGTGHSTLRLVDVDGTNDRSATEGVTTAGGEPRLRPIP